MSRSIPHLDTYVAPGEAPRTKPAPAGRSPVELEATMAQISAEMTEDAIARRAAEVHKTPS